MSPQPAPGAPNAARGIIIVAVAAVLGLFLLARGGTDTVVATDKPKNEPAHVTSTTGNVPPIAPTPTTVAPPTDTKAPADVSVAVFNGTGGAVTGAAGNAKSKLVPLGYSQITLADTTSAVQATAVYFADGFQADAAAIAEALGYDPGVVTPAEGAQTNPGAGIGASVVVVIGTDAASGGR